MNLFDDEDTSALAKLDQALDENGLAHPAHYRYNGTHLGSLLLFPVVSIYFCFSKLRQRDSHLRLPSVSEAGQSHGGGGIATEFLRSGSECKGDLPYKCESSYR